MSLLSVKKLTCSQGVKLLFEDAIFSVSADDTIAIVGPNGCGKTTLLNLLATSVEDKLDTISTQNGLRITYLAQHVKINPEYTILDHLFQSDTAAARAIRQYQKCLINLETDTSDAAQAALTTAIEGMENANAWDYESRVSSILNELDILELSQKMNLLSGGMQKKIALAQIFFEDTDLLILDEPTNHLDIHTIEWLEDRLKRLNCAVVMVTHDRYFLDKLCNKILEIDQQKLYVYTGNYETYLVERDQRYMDQAKHEQDFQTVLRAELVWLRRRPKARSTKQRARKDRVEAMKDRDKPTQEVSLTLETGNRRMGKKILELKDVCKSFDEKRVIDHFSYTFTKGDRIGILGPNGAGKTTLLNIIMNRLQPDSGEVEVGVNTAFAYFDQHSQGFDPTLTIYEHVSQIGSQIKLQDGSTVSAAKLLERFLFPSSSLKTPIGKLSGGEKRRLHLVCLLLENPNFLLFDEPTNDLDIQTLSVLEDFLLNFSGCVIVISHDRYFIDRVVEQLLVFDLSGKINLFSGNYMDYMDFLKELPKRGQKTIAQASNVDSNQNRQQAKAAQKKLNKLENKIEKLEAEKKALNQIFIDKAGDVSECIKAGKQLKALEGELELLMEEWEMLSE